MDLAWVYNLSAFGFDVQTVFIEAILTFGHTSICVVIVLAMAMVMS